MVRGVFQRLRARRRVPPRIIIHAGLHKTGSSTLQNYLYASRAALRDHGFLYPDLASSNHYKLAVAVAGEDEAGRASLAGYMGHHAAAMAGQGPAVLAGIAEQIAGLGDGWLILSHENFAQPARMAQLRSFLQGVAPDAVVHVVCYVRSAPKLYPSVLQQIIKVRRIAKPPNRWLSNHEERGTLIDTIFGERAVVRAYDRAVLTGGDVVEDFRGVVRAISGRTMPPAMAISSNAAMSGAVTALLYRHALEYAEEPPAAFFELRDGLRRFSADRDHLPLRLPPDWAGLIAQRHHARWNTLVDRMDHPELTRAQLKLSGEPPQKVRAGASAMLAWLDSHHDAAFAAEFADWAERKGTLVPGTLAWVRRQTETSPRGS